ncbi:flippase [Dinghuibacter silviterrae]|uniref:PST family polysaccharide transporter n=1 Tax=Dinghuibacter silviterrae TaxID=1539049 RepID=A0A4R8DUE0_9BACT|nr:flippase [Dinghuibacter silviterrae]TDX01779.1 PST family polysaccharide transporter [Dinghuibacter silviterrae]
MAMEAALSVFYRLKTKQKIIFNSFWVVLDKVIRLLGSLVVGVWVTRYLGPIDFGKFNYAGSIIGLSIPLVNLGMNNIVLTEMIKYPKRGDILFTALILKLCSGALTMLAIYCFSLTMHDDQVTRILLIILSAQCILQGQDLFDLFNQSRVESKNTVIAKSTAYLIINIVKAIGLYLGFTIIQFTSLTIAETILGTFILVLFYFRISKQTTAGWYFNWEFARKTLKLSWPLIISDLFIMLYMRLDQLMLKSLAGYAEVGRYSAVVRISEIHYFVAGAISISVYPSIVKMRERGEDAFREGYQKLFNILTTISVSVALFFTVFSGPITHFLYGARFAGIGQILSVHIWTGVFVFLGVGASNWYIIRNCTRYILIFTMTGLFVNIVLNLVLIPRYLSMGAAIATCIAQLFAAVLSNVFIKQTRELFILQAKSFLVFFKPSSKNYL